MKRLLLPPFLMKTIKNIKFCLSLKFKVQAQVYYHHDQCIYKDSLAGYENYLDISEFYKVNVLR